MNETIVEIFMKATISVLQKITRDAYNLETAINQTVAKYPELDSVGSRKALADAVAAVTRLGARCQPVTYLSYT